MKKSAIVAASIAVAMALPAAASAQSGTSASASANAATVQGSIAQFTPRPDGSRTRLDYAVWDEALDFFVLRMGRSTREGAPSVAPAPGTRRTYGHNSRYRMEGNRVVFSYLEPEIIASLSEYRADLERIGSEIDITTLPRNEQLAYWINLHNVAIIEQIAQNWPVTQPSRMEVGETDQTLDEAKFITVAGTALSPKDIRTRIVYANWSDPVVMYGFFRGDIGGPSIMSDAYNGENVRNLLRESADEFVNSLRGVEGGGSTLRVSRIYDEARPFYFQNWSADLSAHLKAYATEDVSGLLAEATDFNPVSYEYDVADLINGRREPSYSLVYVSNGGVSDDGEVPSFRVPPSVQRFLQERQQKINKLIRRGEMTGRVIVIDMETGEAVQTEEVE